VRGLPTPGRPLRHPRLPGAHAHQDRSLLDDLRSAATARSERSSSLASTTRRSRSQCASLAGLGRRIRPSAALSARQAR
jgi:hypothetical protein